MKTFISVQLVLKFWSDHSKKWTTLTVSEISCFRLLSLLQDLQPPVDLILFPAPVNDWPPWKKNTNYCDIRTAVVETTIQGAAEW
jgi:hypothetical protein